MLKETLLNIVDLNFDKKLNNIGVFGQNITTRALEIYNEFKKIIKSLQYSHKIRLKQKNYFLLYANLKKRHIYILK